MNTTSIGDITEQRFILRCMELEIPVLRPVGNNLPYDFVIEYEGGLKKVQVKTARKSKSEDVFVFNTVSTSKNYTEVVQKTYDGKIDYFATEVAGVHYLVPPSVCAKGRASIYVGDTPTKVQILASNYIF